MKQLKTILTIITVCVFTKGFAKDKITTSEMANSNKQHRFVLHATAMYNVNRNSGRELTVWTKNSAKPIRSLHVNNTFGHQVGFTYEYRNKKMISFSPSIIYGVQNLSYDHHYNLDFVDPIYEFPRSTYMFEVRKTAKYLAPSFGLGYDYRVPKNRDLVLQGKLGISCLFPLENLDQSWRVFVDYQKGNDTFGKLQFAYTDVTRFGRSSEIGWPIYNIYFGMTYKMDLFLIKEVRAGINFTHAFGFVENGDAIGSVSNQYFDKQERIAMEEFNDRFRNIGLTVAVGF